MPLINLTKTTQLDMISSHLEWNNLYDVLMNDSNISYISDEAMMADAGRSYQELTDLMPAWGDVLHATGNILPETVLSMIFKYGILLWYVKYFLNTCAI